MLRKGYNRLMSDTFDHEANAYDDWISYEDDTVGTRNLSIIGKEVVSGRRTFTSHII